jgi:hypothetical protein
MVCLAGRNFRVLSWQAELIHWRVSSLVLIGTTALFCVLETDMIVQLNGSEIMMWQRGLKRQDG